MDLKGLFSSKAVFVFVTSFFVFFFSWFFVYKTGINDTAIQSHDTLPALFIPASVSLEGTFNLDEYFEMLISEYPHPDGESVPFYLRVIDGHVYSAFSPVTGLLAVPVYFVPLQLGLPVTFETVAVLGHLSASLMIAGSVTVMYLVFKTLFSSRTKQGNSPQEKPQGLDLPCRQAGLQKSLGLGNAAELNISRISDFGFGILNPLRDDKALWLALVYGFGTCSFALTSQALWQHTASQLFLSLVLYFLVLGFEQPKKAVWSGLFLSLATLARPTGALVVVILSLYFILKFGWELFFRYAFLGLVPLLIFLYIPSLSKGALAGYGGQVGSNWTAPFPLGFLGSWFSPSKGTLIYSPVFIFSFVSVWILVKRWFTAPAQGRTSGVGSAETPEVGELGRLGTWSASGRIGFGISQLLDRLASKEALYYWVFASIVIHSLTVGKWYHWYGGWAFGYRMMSDMIPFLAFLWIPFAKSEYWDKLKYWFYLTAVWSVGIQLAGIAFFDGVWHNLYDRGPDNQAWLWSVRNSEMLYYLRRLIAKLRGLPTQKVR